MFFLYVQTQCVLNNVQIIMTNIQASFMCILYAQIFVVFCDGIINDIKLRNAW